MTKPEIEYWYRYFDHYQGDNIIISLEEFKVVKHTPCGVQLDLYGSGEDLKFVLNDSHKQWACPTIEKAKVSFKRRKQVQINILEVKLKSAELALAIAEENTWDKEVYAGIELEIFGEKV